MLSEKHQSTVVRPMGSVGAALLEKTRENFLEDRANYLNLLERIRQEENSIQVQIDVATRELQKQKAQLLSATDELERKIDSLPAALAKSENDARLLQESISRLETNECTEEERAYFKLRAEEFSRAESEVLGELKNEIVKLEIALEKTESTKKDLDHRLLVLVDTLSDIEEGKTPKDLKQLVERNSRRIQGEFDRKRLSVEEIVQNLTNDLNEQQVICTKLKSDLVESRKYEARLKNSSVVSGFFSRANPFNWGNRDPKEIAADIAIKERLIRDFNQDIARSRTKITELIANHAEHLKAEDQRVRKEFVHGLKDERNKLDALLEATLAEIDAKKDELIDVQRRFKSSNAEYTALLEKRADDARNQQLLDFQRELEGLQHEKHEIVENINELKAEQSTNLSKQNAIEENLEKVESQIKSSAQSRLMGYQKDVPLFEAKLQERALRLGMTGGNLLEWQPPKYTGSNSETPKYGITRSSFDTVLSSTADTLVKLPVSLLNRASTNYKGKKDQIISDLIKIGFTDAVPTDDESQLGLIDSFTKFLFGSESEKTTFYVSCLDSRDAISRLLIRPADVGPRIESVFGTDLVPTLACSLVYDSEKGINRLQYWGVTLSPSTHQRPFERKIEFERRMGYDNDIAPTNSLDDVLDRLGIELPRIRDVFGARADDWYSYVDWGREKLYQQAPKLYLGKGEIKDSVWRGEGIFLGQSQASRFTSASKPVDGKQWLDFEIGLSGELSNTIRVDLTVGEKLQNISKLEGLDTDKAIGFSIELKPKRGKLDAIVGAVAQPKVVYNLSALRGSITQLNRQLAALDRVFGRHTRIPNIKAFEQFERSFGNSPYLAATFFNVAQAAAPNRRVEVPDDHWLNPNLNNDQKDAVRKMLSAPEIAYIQGPPGTGKTSMIAEACSHFVRMNKRVLIASQTNLAVDNALERLADDPRIRCLRIRTRATDEEMSNTLEGWYEAASKHTSSKVLAPLELLDEQIEEYRAKRNKLIPRFEAYKSTVESISELRLQHQTFKAEINRLSEILADEESDESELSFWEHILSVLEGNAWDQAKVQLVGSEPVSQLFEFAQFLDGMDFHVPKSGISAAARLRHVRILLDNICSGRSPDKSTISDDSYEQFRQKIMHHSQIKKSSQREDDLDVSTEIRTCEYQLSTVNQKLDDLEAKRDELHQYLDNLVNSLFSDSKSYSGDVSTRCTVAIDQVDMRISLLEQRRGDYESLKPWKNLLSEWQESAVNPEQTNLKNDQVGEHYKRTVNVAGITCNMSPEKFEEAGLGRFDVVIIDEVSKATPLELLMPLEKAPCAILVGDHRQLPPTFEFTNLDTSGSEKGPAPDENDEAIADEESLLEHYKQLVTSSLFKQGFEQIDHQLRASLLTQYRMHPAIMGLVNRFYDNRLRSGLPTGDHGSALPVWARREHGLTLNSSSGTAYLTPDKHAIWLDSSKDKNGKNAYEIKDGSGVSNQLEIELVTEVVRKMIDKLDQEDSEKTISIITFYNKQKKLLQKEIARALGVKVYDLGKKRIEVETVDRFQGKETDIVLVSMVRNPTHRLSKRSNPAKFERINVAFSRARDLLVITGAEKVFSGFQVEIEPLDGGASKSVPVYGQIIDQIRQQGGFWRAQDILGSQTEGGTR